MRLPWPVEKWLDNTLIWCIVFREGKVLSAECRLSAPCNNVLIIGCEELSAATACCAAERLRYRAECE